MQFDDGKQMKTVFQDEQTCIMDGDDDDDDDTETEQAYRNVKNRGAEVRINDEITLYHSSS